MATFFLHTASRTLLFCPMQWGLGHTVRLVPLISYCLKKGHQVILAADGDSYNFLHNRFPNLKIVRLPFFPVSYPGDGRFFRKLIPQIPGILKAITENQHTLRTLVEQFKIDAIITDHRYGFTHSKVPSVFITNQLWLKAPRLFFFGEPLVYLLHLIAIRKFSQIWVADFDKAPGLSGILTHPPLLPNRTRFIDPVSRLLEVIPEQPAGLPKFELLAILSGPEPQRSILENEIIRVMQPSGIETLILRGKPAAEAGYFGEVQKVNTITLVDHAPDSHLAWFIRNIRVIICRPGNSSLSDLIALGKTALLVPTPGQTEQEYVARKLSNEGYFMMGDQAHLTLDKFMAVKDHFPPRFPQPDQTKWQLLLDQIR